MLGLKALALVGAVSMSLTVPAVADGTSTTPSTPITASPSRSSAVTVLSYRGLGAWVDMYDRGPWAHPRKSVRRMAERGTKTLYVETGSYKQPRAIFKPGALGKMIDTAAKTGVEVVGWYLPSYTNNKRDFRRIKAAIGFTSPGGNRFDSYAIDIEATEERNIAKRNRRMVGLSDRVRNLVGPAFVLGAITPDPVTQQYWPNFPYKKVNARYDVFMPMAYWTYRTSGQKRVYKYTAAALRIIREQTGDATTPIHMIGGIASDATRREVRGFTNASRDYNALGISLYDFPIMKNHQWAEMARFNPPA